MVAHAELRTANVPSPDSPERDELLHSTRLIDAPPEEAFDRLSRIASKLLDAPTALVSLVQGGRQFFKSAVGLGEPWATTRQTPLSHSFCKYVVRDRAPLVVADAREHEILRHNRAISELGVVAYAGMPLVVEDEAIGALCVIDSVPHAWTESQLSLLKDLADVVMSEVGLRRTLRLAEQQRELFETVLAHIEDGVALLDAERTPLMVNAACAHMFGLARDELRGMSRAAFAAHLAPMLESPEAARALLAGKAPEAVEELVLARPHRRVLRRSWTPVRLPDGDGFLATWHDATAEKALLAEREHQLHVDALTGIPNRRAAQAALSVEVSRMRRSGTPLCVAVFDIDHFKRVNDELGHAAGDQVLCQVARALAGAARVTDVVARWGGEEFLAILPADLAGAEVFCERTRAKIEQLPCSAVDRVTISAGLAQLDPDEDPGAAIARADQYLYEAKRAGRNRVMSSPPGMAERSPELVRPP